MNAVAESIPPSLASARHRLSVADFQKMAETGILNENDRIELIDGILVDMAPIGSRHASIVDCLVEALILAAEGKVLVRAQGPLEIPRHSEPMPDLLLLKPRPDRYRRALPLPADVLLAVEVADSATVRDRDIKIPLYGKHGIPEAWLVDVGRRTVTVYTEPSALGYHSAREISEGQVSPACLPRAEVKISFLFG